MLHGTVLVDDCALAREGQLVVLDRSGVGVVVEANNAAVVLLLGGEPTDEPASATDHS